MLLEYILEVNFQKMILLVDTGSIYYEYKCFQLIFKVFLV